MTSTVGTTSTTVYVGGGAPVKVGNATTDLIGFYGITGVAQASAIATVTASPGILSGGVGFSTTAQFSAFIGTVNTIATALRGIGITA